MVSGLRIGLGTRPDVVVVLLPLWWVGRAVDLGLATISLLSSMKGLGVSFGNGRCEIRCVLPMPSSGSLVRRTDGRIEKLPLRTRSRLLPS